MPQVISAEPGSSSGTKDDLLHKYRQIRSFSEQLAVPLTAEDMQLQSMDASPAKWHLAHTTWFFENFLLSFSPAWQPINVQLTYLFNSYYNATWAWQFVRPRGIGWGDLRL